MNFQRKFMPSKPLAPGLHQGVSLQDLKPIHCDNCGGETFIAAMSAYLASPLQTTTGSQLVVQVPAGFLCAKCGKFLGRKPAPNSTKEPDEKEDSNHVNN